MLWLYPLGRVRPGVNIEDIAGKAVGRVAAMAGDPPGVHRSWRSGVDSAPARSPGASRRWYTAVAAANRYRPAPADDSFHRRAAHRLRQHCQPAARALHRAALGCGDAHGAGRCAPQAHSPDSHRERAAEPDRRRCRIGRCLRRVAHDAGAGLSTTPKTCPSRPTPRCRCLAFAFLVSLLTGVIFRNRPGMAVVSCPARRRSARREPLHRRPILLSATRAGRSSSGTLGGPAGRRFSHDQVASQSGAPELRHGHRQSLHRVQYRPARELAIPSIGCPRCIARSKTASPRCPAWPT